MASLETSVCEGWPNMWYFERFALKRDISVNKSFTPNVSFNVVQSHQKFFHGRVTAEPVPLISVLSDSCQYRGWDRCPCGELWWDMSGKDGGKRRPGENRVKEGKATNRTGDVRKWEWVSVKNKTMRLEGGRKGCIEWKQQWGEGDCMQMNEGGKDNTS